MCSPHGAGWVLTTTLFCPPKCHARPLSLGHYTPCALVPVQAIFQEGYAFSPALGCEAYTPPPEGPIDSYTSFIRSLPDTAPPEVRMNSQGCSLHLHLSWFFTVTQAYHQW